MTSRAKSILLISSGLIWLPAVSSLMMASDGVSLRETRLGVIAHFPDKLPRRFSKSYDALICYKTVTPLEL